MACPFYFLWYFCIMFNKNIEALKGINPTLTTLLTEYSFDKARVTVDIAKAQSDDFILLKDNTPLECTTNPIEEAFYNVQTNVKQNLDKFDFIVLYGLGIGYTLDYLFEKYESRIIVLEPDIDVLRVGFEMVDYSTYLDSGRVFITNSDEEVYKHLFDNYLINDKFEIIFLQRYLQLYSEEIKTFTTNLYSECKHKVSEVNKIKNKSKSWVYSTLSFAKNSGQMYPINLLNDKFQGKTALVVDTGVSSNQNLDCIRKFRDRYIIFALNESTKVLMKNSIIPDFSIFLEENISSELYDKDVNPLKDLNFIIDNRVPSSFYDLPKKRCFTYYQKNNVISEEIAVNNHFVTLFDDYKSNIICALNCIKNLGFKNVILAGCDLAFENTICSNKKEKTVPVKSVTGEFINTNEDNIFVIKQIESFVKNNPSLEYYNITAFGAYIDGVESHSLTKCMKIIPVYTDNNSCEEVLNKTIYESHFNPIKLKHIIRNLVKNDEQSNFEIRVDIKAILEKEYNDDMFYIKVLQILEKIAKTLFLSQLIKYDVLKCTKLLAEPNNPKKRAIFELFIENTLKNLDELNTQLAKI